MRYGLFVVAESDSPDAGILTTCLVSSLEEAVLVLDTIAEYSGGTCVLYHVGYISEVTLVVTPISPVRVTKKEVGYVLSDSGCPAPRSDEF